jgi:hypothetical protein
MAVKSFITLTPDGTKNECYKTFQQLKNKHHGIYYWHVLKPMLYDFLNQQFINVHNKLESFPWQAFFGLV